MGKPFFCSVTVSKTTSKKPMAPKSLHIMVVNIPR